MNPAKIVMGEMERKGSLQILPLFTEGVGEPGQQELAVTLDGSKTLGTPSTRGPGATKLRVL